MITQGWPLWAVHDGAVYAIVGWTEDVLEPIGIMLNGNAEEGRAAEVLACSLVLATDIEAVRRLAA